jgi:osmoprotectant transport system ATP-binding protein
VIELDRVSKRYGETVIVDAVSFTVAKGELFVLVGPSGSGKTTLLRLVNRLVPASAGRIAFAGADILSYPEETLRRRMGYVIQSIGLFPHWTVARNIAAVPRLLGWSRARIAARIDELLDLVDLPAAFRDRYPHQLSGGQQQRVGVARALAADPELLLMDEPFASLDPLARAALQAELPRIQERSGTTILFVTHDIAEALALATRIALLDRGRLLQIGTPLELLTRPASSLVRDFLGSDEIGLRLLGLERVVSRMRPGAPDDGAGIAAEASLRQALSAMLAQGVDRLAVTDGAGVRIGALHLADLVRRP